MKLDDPSLEALVAAYRAEVRPTASGRSTMWAKIHRTTSTPGQRRVTYVAMAAAAAAIAAWAGLRALSGEATPSDQAHEQAVYGEVGRHSRGAATERSTRSDAQIASKRPPSGAASPDDVPQPERSAPRTAAHGSSATGPVRERSAAPPRSPKDAWPLDRPAATDARENPGTHRTATTPGNEVSLIAAAEQALREGRPQEALTLLAEHQRRFPGAGTTQERKAMVVIALCELGRKAEGRGALHVFMQQFPVSAYRDRLAAACETP